MARLARIATKAFNLECDSKITRGSLSAGGKKTRYDLLYEAAGFGPGPRLGRLVAQFIILPKPRAKRSPKRRGTRRSR